MLPRPARIARRILPAALRGYLRRFFAAPGESPAARFIAAGDRCGCRLCAPGRPSLSGFFCRRRYRSLRQDGARTRARDQFWQRAGPRMPWGSPNRRRPVLGALGRNYHPKFYSALRKTLAEHDPAADLAPLDRLIEENAYADDGIRRIERSAEDLRGIPDSSIDIVVSNAVLEHLFDLPAACRELGRVSKPLAWGFHQVDFRDHRDFQRPLEFLLLGDRQFRRIFAERHGECGSQWRPSEAAEFFEKAGFEVMRFEGNMFADENYLGEFELRLRKSASRYRDMPLAELRTLGGLFRLRRRSSHSAAGN